MANVFSTVFANVVTAGANPMVLYTVPAGNVAVIKNISLLPNLPIMTRNLQCSIQTGSANVVLYSIIDPYAYALRNYHWWGMAVVLAGQNIRAVNAVAGWHIHISGYLLTLP